MSGTRGARGSNGQLRDVLDAAHEAYLRVDVEGVVIDANRAARELFGLDGPVTGRSFLALRPPASLADEYAHLSDVRRVPDRPARRTGVIRPVDGDAREFDATVWADDRDGRRSVHLLLRDVSERQVLQQECTAQARRLEEAQRIAGIGSFEWDLTTGRQTWSGNMRRLLELPPDAPPSHELFLARVHPDDRDLVENEVEASLRAGSSHSYETRVLGRDGQARWIEIRVEIITAPDGTARRRIGIVHDITERKQAEGELQRRATTDPLTALANRAQLDTVLADLLATTRRRHVGLLLVGLDDLDEVSDSFGRDAGDQILRGVAERLTSVTSGGDLAARRDGDEFVVVLDGIDGPADVIAAAADVQAALAEPFDVGGALVRVGASVGIVPSAVDGTDPQDLLDKAHAAMCRAKGLPARWAVFEEAADRLAGGRVQLAADLRDAIADGALHLAYQPIVSLRTRQASSFEALARWDHPEHGPVPPDRFVPLAEQAGLAVALTELVLRRATSDCAGWLDAGHDLRVAVNVSPVALEDPGVVATVRDALQATGLAAGRLVLEITESAVAVDVEQFNGVLEQLRLLGVGLVVDDFGTGYSAMSHLKDLPGITGLKIDRAFVRDITLDTRDLAIVRSLVRLAQSLSLRVVAEGVESVMALELLAGLSCDAVQGFGIARPMPTGEVLPWLEWHTTGEAHAPLEPHDLLVVDDSETVRAHLTDLAEQGGWEVRTAESAEAAISEVDRSCPDVIVLDHQMPGMSGVETVPVLRQRGYDGPILLFTGFLTDAIPHGRIPLDVWPVAKANPDAVLDLLDAYRATLTI